METLRPLRGTRDLIGEERRRHEAVLAAARRAAATYGFEEWETPIIEDTRVFARSLGDTSDVVMKEMYSFTDRGGESVTLRPENTAGVCRALVSSGLTQNLPQKVFYAGPMFRYERPQKGRFRQFHQIGVELLGPNEPFADGEVIALGWDILAALELSESVVLELNTLGDLPSRQAWREALVAYFRARRSQLSAESRARLERNPLRILDSKDEADQTVIAEAPAIGPYLSPETALFHDRVKETLARFEVPFRDNPRLVRGLDYYSHTAFEFVTNELGAQGTVMAGGRYHGLVAEMGGPPVSGVGWSAGIERLALLIAPPPPLPALIAVVPADEAGEAKVPGVLRALRSAGLRAESAYRGNLRHRLEQASRRAASAAVIIGQREAARGVAQLKDFASGAQEEVALAELAARLTGHESEPTV